MNFNRFLLLSVVTAVVQINAKIPSQELYAGEKVAMMPENIFAQEKITGDSGEIGYYYPGDGTAFLKSKDGSITHYEKVVTISGPYTPPLSVSKGAAKYFASMPNPNYTHKPKGFVGGPNKVIKLYGVIAKTPKQTTKEKRSKRKMKKDKAITIEITGIGKFKGQKGIYVPIVNMANLATGDDEESKNYFSNVVEYSQAVTPPNIENPSLVLFANMPNPEYIPINMPGVERQNIALYGVPINTNPPSGFKKLKTKLKNRFKSKQVMQLEAGPKIPTLG